jgi:prepilin-type processing-associated H-X9-DG protein
LQRNVSSHPDNHAGRVGDITTYLCPSDPSTGVYIDQNPQPGVTPGPSGRSNYFGNAGAHGWWKDVNKTVIKPPKLAGVFGNAFHISVIAIIDGTSNTILFAEVMRGAMPNHGRFDVTLLLPPQWGVGSPATNLNNSTPLPPSLVSLCEKAAVTDNLTGLQFYRGSPQTALYTHTLPPNYAGRDCMSLNGDQFHLASRSNHTGGVNVCLADGSVHPRHDLVRHMEGSRHS